jgi:geranylgeranyl diphosphate synthase type I
VQEPRESSAGATVLGAVRELVDPVLERFLGERRAEVAAMDEHAAVLVDELVRLVAAGGKRIRPALCLWAYRGAGGREGEPILRACAALELLHTSAIVHDDVIDRSDERRGVAATHVRFAKEAPPGVDPDGFGAAGAILVGDLALVLSEQLLRTSGFPDDRLGRAMTRFDRMRAEMAAGQFLDVSGTEDRARVAALKTGSYTAEGPVLVGCALARAGSSTEGALRVYARLVGEAFQLRDDVVDGDPSPDASSEIGRRIEGAIDALAGAAIRADAAGALTGLAELLRAGP